MVQSITFVKYTVDNYMGMISYTPTGVIVALTDGPYVSTLVEYDNNGEVLHIEVECAPEVKEL